MTVLFSQLASAKFRPIILSQTGDFNSPSYLKAVSRFIGTSALPMPVKNNRYNAYASRRIVALLSLPNFEEEVFEVKLDDIGRFTLYSFLEKEGGPLYLHPSQRLAREKVRLRVFQEGGEKKIEIIVPDKKLGGNFPKEGYVLFRNGRNLSPAEVHASKYRPGLEGDGIIPRCVMTALERQHLAHYLKTGQGDRPNDWVFPMPQATQLKTKEREEGAALSIYEYDIFDKGIIVGSGKISVIIPLSVIRSDATHIAARVEELDNPEKTRALVFYAQKSGEDLFRFGGRVLAESGELLDADHARALPCGVLGIGNVPNLAKSLPGI